MATAADDDPALRRRLVERDDPPVRPRAGRPRVSRRRKTFVELLLSPLSFVLGEGDPEDPQTAARTFTRSLRQRYGDERTPRFEHTSFRDAVSTARTASKLLLVFLHSTIHDDADVFCRNAMCTDRMRVYLNNSDGLVAWAGCVQSAEGFGVSLALGCATFPFVALLSCVSRSLHVVEKITANVSVEDLVATVQAALDRNTHVLTTARHRHQQRTEAQLLREQQDVEYQESLAADRRREQEAREQAERQAMAQKRQEEENRRVADAELLRKQEAEAEIEAKRVRLAAGPTSRVPPPGADYRTAVLKFHLHNGTRLNHMFYAHDTLKTVRDFIDVEFYDRGITIRNYELATNFPKKVYGPELVNVTLADAGLAPQALVYVQDLDS